MTTGIVRLNWLFDVLFLLVSTFTIRWDAKKLIQFIANGAFAKGADKEGLKLRQ